MPIQQKLFSPVNAFIQGRQARQQEDYGESRNALAQMEVQNAPQEMANRNKLLDLQTQGAERNLSAEKAKFAYATLKQAMDSGNPKGFVLQHVPDLVSNMQRQGTDLQSMSDQEAAQYFSDLAGAMAGKAGIAPPVKVKTFGDTADPGAGILQEDPTTGVLKQVVAPQKPDNFATGQANADRRAREQREHAATLAQQQRDFTAEQNQLNRDAKRKPTTPSPEAAAQKLDSAMNTLSAIKDVKDKIGLMTAGPGGQLMRAFAGTDASDMEANIDTIKANIGFDRLQMMRDASKTGGALGGIAVQELNLLQSTIASLNPKQSPDQLRRNLEKVEAQYAKSVEAYSRALGIEPPAAGGDSPQQPPSGVRSFSTEAEAEAAGIQPGTRVVIGGVSGMWQ